MTTAVTSLRGTTARLSPVRKIIAQRTLESLRVSAQLTSVVEADVTKLVAARSAVMADVERRIGIKPSYFPFMVYSALAALRRHPVINASIDEAVRSVTYHDAEHAAIAVDTPRGLLAPVIPDAGEMTVEQLTTAIAEVADGVRDATLSAERLSGGTFTITNTGSRGSLFDTPIINQPQVAILGTGAVVERPIVVVDAVTAERTIEARSMMYLSLSYDHRLVDGSDAARYLVDVKQEIEAAEFRVAG